jgi:hypothetical protein
MVDRVNAKLPKDQRFNPTWWYAPKTWRLFREYCRLFPGGKLHILIYSLGALMFLSLMVAAWALGFF